MTKARGIPIFHSESFVFEFHRKSWWSGTGPRFAVSYLGLEELSNVVIRISGSPSSTGGETVSGKGKASDLARGGVVYVDMPETEFPPWHSVFFQVDADKKSDGKTFYEDRIYE